VAEAFLIKPNLMIEEWFEEWNVGAEKKWQHINLSKITQ